MTKRLAVNEIFGVTIQGEGRYTGKPVMFLRLAGCNLACDWCDTPYSWDWAKHDIKKESQMMEVGDVLSRLMIPEPKHLVITGGEPMLQADALVSLVNPLKTHGWDIEIETNGTKPPLKQGKVYLPVSYNVSPKLKNSGNDTLASIKNETLILYNGSPDTIFKFVVYNPVDFDEIDKLVRVLGLDKHKIWIMPGGIDSGEILDTQRRIVDDVIARGYRLSTRLHVLIWDNKRGV